MVRTGAELLVDTLVAHGVRHLFTVSGNHVLALYDATLGRDIRLIHTRHEAAAVHMADAWGRLTGEPGVAVVTGGPGHCNALSALYGALMAEAPVVLLSGHCAREEVGRGGFQELDQVAAAAPVSKASWLAETPAGLGRDMARALSVARSGRPGPVHVSLPQDVLEAEVGDLPPAVDRPDEPRPLATADVRQVLSLLAGAARPLIVTGPAMGRGAAWATVTRLADRAGIPALVMESPRGVNDPGLRGGTRSLARADVVLLFGKRLDFSLRFGRGPAFSERCRFARIDVDAGSSKTDGPAVLGVAADPRAATEQLLAASAEAAWPDREGWRQEVAGARTATPAAWAGLRESAKTPIHPLRVCAAIQPYLDAGGVLVSDGGEFGQWAQAGLEAGCRLINGPSGSIGSAVPMALAAKLAFPERTVLVTVGDGTFGYAALELDTAVRYGLPVVVIVGNDARWNAEYQLQVRRYGPGRAVGCELLPSRYDLVAEALGGQGEAVERPEQLAGALERAVASGRPACLNVLIEGVPAPTFPLAD